MQRGPSEIKSLEFGIYSTDEIKNLSVVEVSSTKKYGINSIYDSRMGPLDDSKCQTCGKDAIGCVGHFGHISLVSPLIHPLYVKEVITILRCICIDCKRLKLTREHLKLKGLNFPPGEEECQKRHSKKSVYKILNKINICTQCKSPQPTYRHNSADSIITMTIVVEKKKHTIEITPEEIYRVLHAISEEDLFTMGYITRLMTPSSLIMHNILVLPPCSRPYVKDGANVCDDDLSNQYLDILKANNRLKDPEVTSQKYNKNIQTLKFRIATTFNNSAGRAKHTTNGRPVKCIKTRISGKDGQMRANIMGRRAEQTARTVIGPDSTLRNGEMIVPVEIAHTLTIPVRVTNSNFNEIKKAVYSHKARYLIRQMDGSQETRRINLDHALSSQNSHFKIKIGDIVERTLVDGDYVVLNRQPTLHKASMMAFKIFVKSAKTFRFNLACTKAFNADFDGDEMNIHVPQTLEAQTEVKELSTVKQNLVNGQSSKMNICLVQDAILGAYLMTKRKDAIPVGKFFQCCMRILHGEKNRLLTTSEIVAGIDRIKNVFEQNGQVWNTGRGLISLILPPDFDYCRPDDELTIKNGVVLSGFLTKATIGNAHNCIPHHLFTEYSAEWCMSFIDNIQFVATEWLQNFGFSIGIGDCFRKGTAKCRAVEDSLHKCFMEAACVENRTRNPVIKESRINGALTKAKDIGMKIATASLLPTNNFISTVKSGSKGDFFNIAQITGLLGQQNISGKRIPNFINNGNRSIPHYELHTNLPPSKKYEARGMIASSFINGLNPREFFFHACSGREGMSDTAVGTAVSGYIQRRIVKLQEDMRVQYDGTVRDETQRIFQFQYGQGFDPSQTIRCNGKQFFTDVKRIASKYNKK